MLTEEEMFEKYKYHFGNRYAKFEDRERIGDYKICRMIMRETSSLCQSKVEKLIDDEIKRYDDYYSNRPNMFTKEKISALIKLKSKLSAVFKREVNI